jgi:hypothetical protein
MGKLRDKILTSGLFSEVVQLPKPFDVKVEVRARTVAQQYDILKRVRRADGEINTELLAVETVIACTFDPDTGDRVFDAADRDELLKLDAAAFNVLLAAANRGAGVESEDEATTRLKETSPDATSTD